MTPCNGQASRTYHNSSRYLLRLLAITGVLSLLAGCSTLPHFTVSSSDEAVTPATTAAKAEPIVFTLSYDAEDSLNPYKAKIAQNQNMWPLLYEGLVMTDAQLQPQLALAGTINEEAPLSMTVTLRSDARFSDGSAVTAADVTASFTQAKASTAFKVLLSNVTAAAANANNGSITFTLASADPHARTCLLFPVMKASTVTTDLPVGSGPYVFQGGDSPSLKANTHRSHLPTLTSVVLKSLSDDDAILHSLENGSISYYFSDLSDGEIPRTSSSSIAVPLNYLVFLGVNSHKTALSNALVRQALSAGIDRTNLCASSFAGRAQAATAPFPSFWKPAATLKGVEAGENIAVAVAQLAQAGYNTTGNTAIGGTPAQVLTLELLVNKDNAFRAAAADTLKTQLSRSGITLTITELPFKEYEARIRSKQFDLYLGEMRLAANMSLLPLLQSGGSAAYGVAADSPAAAAYQRYRAGEVTMQEFTDTFKTDLPFIPLCWREGIAAFNRSLTGVVPTALNIYDGIENWAVAS